MHQSPGDQRPRLKWANDQLKLGMYDDQACLQCHSDMSEDISQHTHHVATSEGSRCYNCHMPHTTYGLLKAIRSHTVSSPSVQHDDLQAGRPNACNLCHSEQTAEWASTQITDWYGTR